MCFKTPAIPKPTPVQPAPSRSDVDTGVQRRKLAAAGGVTSNIFTSALGDTNYGKNAMKLATLGATV